MLKIFNELPLFFNDCYRRIGVREYARLQRISPPTASTLLAAYEKEGLLEQEKDRRSLLYVARRESSVFIALSQIYWRQRLERFLQYLEKELLDPTVILFGSLAKAEAKADSDIDIAIIGRRKPLHLQPYERELGRKMQLFWFLSVKEIKPPELAINIINGYRLRGNVKWYGLEKLL